MMMTEYELYDLLNSSQQTMAAISVAIVSQQSAFAVAVHLIGPKVKAPVFWVLTVCYSIYLYGPITGFMACRQRFVNILEKLHELNGITESSSFLENYINVSIFIFIWIVTLAYATYIRFTRCD